MRSIDIEFPPTNEDLLRQKIMRENVHKYAKGKTLIITGAGHLDHLQKEFPQIKILLE